MPQPPPFPVPVLEEAPSSRLASEVQIYSQDPGYIVATTGRYFVLLVKDRLNATGIGLIRRAVADMCERHETFGYLTLLEPTADLAMTPDLRDNMQLLIRRYTSRFSGAAIVYEKTGFHGTAVRSIVTAINVASRAEHPNRVFAAAREAIAWLARLTPGEPTAAHLLEITTQLRSTLAEGRGTRATGTR